MSEVEEGLAGSRYQAGVPPLLGRKSVLMGMLTSGFVIANAAQSSPAVAGTVKPSSTIAAQSAYAEKWKSATAYVRGTQVISPNNDVVSATIAHTSSVYATDTSMWTLSGTYSQKGAYGFDVKDYGAKGDGVTDDTAAIQATIAAAAAVTPVGRVYAPQGNYRVTSSLVSVGTKALVFHGDSKNTTTISANDAGFTGYIIHPLSSFDIGDLTLVGNGKDGTYGLGGTAGTYGGTVCRHLNIYSTEYGVRFAQAAEFPLNSVWADIFVFDVRSCGIQLATGGTSDSGQGNTPGSGQSAWSFDNIVVTNGGTPNGRSLPATGRSVTANSPNTTHDALSWSSTGATEFGWVIMRRATGSVDTDAWAHVDYAGRTTTTYSAVKTAGQTFDYTVLRNSTGVHLRYGKAVSIGSMQTEYVGTGVRLENTTGVTMAVCYDEWHGIGANPTPRGDGVRITNSTGVVLETGWGELVHSVVSIEASQGVRIGSIQASSCAQSAIHYVAYGAGGTLELGAITITGTTPVALSTDGGAYSANITGRNLRNTPDLANRQHVGHSTVAEFVAEYRGVTRATLGGDGVGGYVRLGSTGPLWRSGTGSPEGVLTAPVGSFYSRTDGAAGTTWYVKESGTGNTGWIAK